MKNKTLVEIFDRIQEQVKINIVGDLELLQKGKRLDLHVDDMELASVLLLLSDKCQLDMFIDGELVVIRQLTAARRQEISNRVRALVPRSKISGRIVDQRGEPLSGVSISDISKNTTYMASDGNGYFEFEFYQDAVLNFSMLGYQPKQLKLRGQKELHVELEQLSYALDSLDIPTGYSNRKAGSFIGAASVIPYTKLANFNTNNTLRIIENIEPAFKVHEDIFHGGNPNQIPRVTVRGINNVGNYVVNSPLIILDGFEVSLERLYDLDVNRIERIVLLKDIGSMVLYGSRGGNGVLLVETKKPTPGRLRIDLDYRLSLATADLSDYNLMNAQQKLAFEKYAGKYKYQGNPQESPFEQLDKQTSLDNLYNQRLANVLEGVDTDWLMQAIRQELSNAISIRLQGGTQKIVYGFSAHTSRLNAVMRGSGRDRSGSQLNLVYKPTKALEIGSSSNYEYRAGYGSSFGNFQDYALMNPYQRLTNDKGRLLPSYPDEAREEVKYNPVYNASLPFKDSQMRKIFSQRIFVEHTFNQSLSFKGNFNYEQSCDQNETFLSPLNSRFLKEDDSKKGLYQFSTINSADLYASVNLGYSRKIASHFFQMNLVTELRDSRTSEQSNHRSGFSPNQQLPSRGGYLNSVDSSDHKNADRSRLLSGIATGMYTFQETYIIDFSYRLDGSSKFGENNPFGQFWSVGTSYNLKHSLLSELHWINALTFFINTGVAGTDAFLNNMTKSSYLNAEQRQYLNQTGFLYNNQGNPNLKWPKIKSTSVGTRISILQDRLRFSMFAYSKYTNRMVSFINTAPSLGIPGNGFYENIGKVKNVGIESELYTKFYASENQDISAEFSLSAVRNRGKLLELNDELQNMNLTNLTTDRFGNYHQNELYQVGESLLNLKGVQSLGIDHISGKEYFFTKFNTVTERWDPADITVIGNKEAELLGSMQLGLNFKALTLQAYLYYSIGGHVYNYTSATRIENQDPWLNTDRRALQNRWKQPGDAAGFKEIANASRSFLSSRFVETENYIRLSSILLSYRIPEKFIEKYHLKTLRLQLAANDLFISSTVKMERGLNYPLSRSFNFGLSTEF
ncbi:MAG: SusC/RagA family TonB-linked outer membrane protein [Sphingobacterium hotanense]